MPPQEGKGLWITAPQPILCTGSYYQIPIPVMVLIPTLLNHRLAVTIISRQLHLRQLKTKESW